MKIRMKSLLRQRTFEKTYRADEKVTQAIVEKSKKQFLYKDGTQYIMMDTEDFSQFPVEKENLQGKEVFMKEGMEVELMQYEGEILDVDLPVQVVLNVSKASPGLKGDTVSGSTKKVELETGLTLDVPLFIEQGDNVSVDTRTGAYISRAE